MISQTFVAWVTAILMAGLLIEAWIFRALHADPPSTYRLYAVRDKLMRLVVEGAVGRHEPHFEALYENVNVLLKGCRRLTGPAGWRRAETDGRHLAHHPDDHVELVQFPAGTVPRALEPVIRELCDALNHVATNHFGLFVVMNARRRELSCIQKERAKQLLRMIPRNGPQERIA